jgi:hypothetical protein
MNGIGFGGQDVLDRLIEWMVFNAQRRKIKRQFAASQGYEGDFENPRTLQEKIQFRKLYGNHAFYALVADKYRVRDYVAAKVGEEYLIPLLGVYDRLDRAVFDALPPRFIIKANHGCKWNQIVHDKSTLDIDRTIRHFNKLCRRRYGRAAGERHYNFIPPKIVIETLLPGPAGDAPWDYGFFCYHGPTGFDYHYSIGAPDGRTAAFERNGDLVASTFAPEVLAAHAKPANFDTMVNVATALSADFDFVRVDLYNVDGKIYFGELTCTPKQGYSVIKSKERQKTLDARWRLDAGNPLLYRAPHTHRFKAGA